MMRGKNKTNVISYLTYSQLFGQKMDYGKIEDKIKETSIYGLLPILSQLASIRPESQRYEIFKMDLRKYLIETLEMTCSANDENREVMEHIKNEIDKSLSSTVAFSPQGILFLMKHVIVLSKDESAVGSVQLTDNYLKALILLLSVSDYLYHSDKEPLSEIFSSYLFNNNEDLGVILSRNLLIYIELVRDPDLISDPSFVDINKDFSDKYKCTLEDYILTVFGVYALYLSRIPEKNRITQDWFQDIEEAFRLTRLKEVAQEIINPLIFSIDEGREELSTTYQDPWDYRFFGRKPLIKIKDNIFFPVSLTFLEHCLTDGLYWKIRSCYPDEDNSYRTFFGEPFQRYVCSLVRESCNKSQIPYQIIEEFYYSKGGTRSPDIMVTLGTKLLAFECKAKMLNFKKSVIEGDLDSIEKDRIGMTVTPMIQLYNRVKELLSGASKKVDFSKINEVYLIVVNQGSFPNFVPLRVKTEKDWANLKGISIKVNFFSVSVAELEMLCSVIEKRKPIFRILDHRKYFPNQSFKQFIHTQHPKLKLPQVLNKAKIIFKELKKDIFVR